MKYEMEDKDLLVLWQYFQDRSTSVKGAMFNTITWVLGFAAVILGTIFISLTKFDASYITLDKLLIYASLAGLALSLYAYFAIGESAKHIKNNWKFADNCKDKIVGLDKILEIDTNTNKNTNPVVPIWWQLNIVVTLFAGAFVAILIHANDATRRCSTDCHFV